MSSPNTPSSKKHAAGPAGAADRPDIRTLHLWQIQPVRDILVIASVVGIIYLGSVLSMVTVPMLLALTLAYLFEPVVRRLTRTGKFTRPLATLTIIVVVTLTVALPLVIGGAFAIVQGASYAGQIIERGAQLHQVALEPTDQAKIDALGPAGGWRKLGELIRDIELGKPPPKKADGTPGDVKPDVKPDAKPDAKQSDAPSTPSNEPAPADSGATPPASPTEGSPPAEAAGTPKEPLVKPAGANGNGTKKVEDEWSFERGVAWISAWARDNTGTIGRVTRQVFGTSAEALAVVARFVKSLALLAFSGFLTLFFFFFFSSRWGGVQDTLISLVPAQNREKTLELTDRMDRVIAAFIRGRLIIMGILSGLYVVTYWIIGVPAPLVVGIIVGVFSAVPYLPLLGIPLSIILMFLMPVGVPHTWTYILTVPVITYFLIQMSDDYLWTPMIQGKATDMDTPTILFAVLSGALLGGFYGVLLAIPIGACFKIVFKEVLVPRFRAWAEGRARDFLPISHEQEAPVDPKA